MDNLVVFNYLSNLGYPCSHALASALKNHAKRIFNDTLLQAHFVNPETGKVYKAGEQIKTRLFLEFYGFCGIIYFLEKIWLELWKSLLMPTIP